MGTLHIILDWVGRWVSQLWQTSTHAALLMLAGRKWGPQREKQVQQLTVRLMEASWDKNRGSDRDTPIYKSALH